jgi:CRP-like cAMP-binding protein
MISLMLRMDALTDIETWLAHHADSRAIAKDARVFASGEKPASLFWVTAGELQLVRHTPQGERVILQRCSRGALAEADSAAPTRCGCHRPSVACAGSASA